MGSAGKQDLSTRRRDARAPGFIPVALALALTAWAANPTAFIAEDSYFYAVVARNLATRGVQSFWATALTNGVHPLWLYLLAAWDWVVALLDPALLHHPASGVPVAVALLAVGARQWWRIARLTALPASLLLAPQLAFLTVLGVLYSEAHAAFAAHACLLYVACLEEADGRPRPVGAGLALAAVFLARLDNAFYVAAFLAWYAARRPRRSTAALALVAAVAAAAYLGANLVWFGGLVPVSGFLKSSFPHPLARGFEFYGGTLVAQFSGYSLLFGWLPLLAGAVVAWRRPRLQGARSLLYPLLAGTAGHALYTAVFTGGFTFWYWYYLLPVTLGCWALATSSGLQLTATTDRRISWAVVCITAAALVLARSGPPTGARTQGLRTLEAVRRLGLAPSALLLAEWPGTVAFFTRHHIVAADLLTSNRQLVQRVVTAGNGFDPLFGEAARLGQPIRYVVYNGGIFLVPSEDMQALEYRDPRLGRIREGRVIGRLQLGRPLYSDGDIVVWRAP